MSSTNGWDAILALDESAVNTILLQQYLNDGPGSGGAPIVFTPANWYSAMSVTLSPPLLTFATDGTQSASLSASVVSAVDVQMPGFANTPNLPGQFNAQWLPVSGLSIQRTAQLQSLPGSVDSLGEVAVVFTGPGSTPPQSLLQVLDDFVASHPIPYTIGVILNTDPGPGLEPTAFDFAIQPQSGATPPALLLLIRTSGSGGTSGPLTASPLPDGFSAAVIVSGSLLFETVMPVMLAAALANGEGVGSFTISSQSESAGGWAISATGGSANLLYFGGAVGGATGPVLIPFGSGSGNSFVVQTDASGNLQMNFNSSDYQCSGGSSPTLDLTSATIHFDNALSTYCPYGEGFYSWGPEPHHLTPISDLASYPGFFPGLNAISVNAFSLSNLLFPQGNVLTLSGFSFDAAGDLTLNGDLATAMTVSPAVATVAPGGTVQFTASAPVIWEASQGGFNEDALYTAPETNVPLAITITAINDSTSAPTYALVNVVPTTPAFSFTISPQSVLSDGNAVVGYSALDQNGNGLAVTWAVSCNNVLWMVSSPSQMTLGIGQYGSGGTDCSLDVGTVVTITATLQSDPSQVATATYVIGSADPMTINGSQPPPGESAQFSASAASGETGLLWAVWPGDGPSVVPSGDGASATVTAPPASFTKQWQVVAFYMDPTTFMFGSAVWTSS